MGVFGTYLCKRYCTFLRYMAPRETSPSEIKKFDPTTAYRHTLELDPVESQRHQHDYPSSNIRCILENLIIYKHNTRGSSNLAKPYNRGREVHESLMRINSFLTLRRKIAYFLPNLTGGEMSTRRRESIRPHRGSEEGWVNVKL